VRGIFVKALSDGERAVNDIVHVVDIDQSGVSRHLRSSGKPASST
jgi:hypothetical protein